MNETKEKCNKNKLHLLSCNGGTDHMIKVCLLV